MTKAILVELPFDTACEWVARSLGEGDGIAAAILAGGRIEGGHCHVFLNPQSPSRIPMRYDHGGSGMGGTLIPALIDSFEQFAVEGASCLIVEDSLRRKRDDERYPPTIPSAYIGERVVHWQDLRPGKGNLAADMLYDGSSSYPCNAFVTSSRAEELGLRERIQLGESFVAAVSESLLAVIVSAFDGETFMIWDDS